MPERRHRPAAVWLPVAASALVQLGTTFGAIGHRTLAWQAGAFGAVSPGSPPARPALTALLVLFALMGPLLLVFIRRDPGPVLLGVTAAAVVGTAVGASFGLGGAFYVSVLFGAAIAVLHGARVWAWSAVSAHWLAVIGVYVVARNPAGLFWIVPLTLLSVASVVIPEAARSRRAERERHRAAEDARRADAAQAERVRIARELHDVLAHSLSQINVQASVGLHLFAQQPDRAEAALASIKDSSSSALAEVRQVLGVLRDGPGASPGAEEAPLAPEPELSRLPELVAGVRAQGIAVTLRMDVPDAAGIPLPVQQAAYRIAQEALTNVARHARAAHAEVAVAAGSGRLRMRIADDGVGAAAAASGDGRGLLGMRERAALLGGTLVAGARPGGGFEVVAELPIGATA